MTRFSLLSRMTGLTRLLGVALLALVLVGCDSDGDDGPMGPDDPGPTQNIAEIASVTSTLSTLNAALMTAELDDDLGTEGPFTVFAPLNGAFDPLNVDALLATDNRALLTEILGTHVVVGQSLGRADLSAGQTLSTLSNQTITIGSEGGTLTVNGIPVTTTTVEASNGIVHVIEGVILPPVSLVERAVITGETSTLVTALQTAGLVGNLQGDGPFTVFAPVNSAFAGLGDETINNLLAEDNRAILTEVLTYHVVTDTAIRAGDLSDGQTQETLQGSAITVGVDGGTVTINGNTVVQADIEVENGVIHLIDGVLTETLDVVERAIITAETATLVTAVTTAGLAETLQQEDPITVFAPVNGAFAGLGDETINNLLAEENRAILTEVLTYHVVPGAIRAGDLIDGQTAPTLEGGTLSVGVDGSTITINGNTVVQADIEVENGVIHLIDGVLTETLDAIELGTVTAETTTLITAVRTAGLTEALQAEGPFTIFAPTNSAFADLGDTVINNLLAEENRDLLDEVLGYHVVPGLAIRSTDLSDGQMAPTLQGDMVTAGVNGSTVTINGNTVIRADIEVENGVIHLIDGVLTETLDIVDTARLQGFSTLVTAIGTANLATALQQPEGPFTVFAPTNEAFEGLPDGELERLLNNPGELADILRYHVVSGTVRAGDLTDGLTAPTLEGNDVTFTVTDTEARVNGALIGPADIETANGVIHVIDTVLLPPSDS
ncbi:MAG: fasciclin domain-containing protein [Bacteroidota bacterium]